MKKRQGCAAARSGMKRAEALEGQISALAEALSNEPRLVVIDESSPEGIHVEMDCGEPGDEPLVRLLCVADVPYGYCLDRAGAAALHEQLGAILRKWPRP